MNAFGALTLLVGRQEGHPRTFRPVNVELPVCAAVGGADNPGQSADVLRGFSQCMQPRGCVVVVVVRGGCVGSGLVGGGGGGDDVGTLLPDGRRRVGVRQLRRRDRPPQPQADSHTQPGADPRRRPSQVLQPRRQKLQASAVFEISSHLRYFSRQTDRKTHPYTLIAALCIDDEIG